MKNILKLLLMVSAVALAQDQKNGYQDIATLTSEIELSYLNADWARFEKCFYEANKNLVEFNNHVILLRMSGAGVHKIIKTEIKEVDKSEEIQLIDGLKQTTTLPLSKWLLIHNQGNTGYNGKLSKGVLKLGLGRDKFGNWFVLGTKSQSSKK
ncbi:MAG: hypothetical protein ACK5TH_18175 [Prosthecobacter sp.]